MEGVTNFLPTQFLGPTENGWTTERLSFSYLGSREASQRSGMNDNGSAKLDGDVYAAHWGIPPVIFVPRRKGLAYMLLKIRSKVDEMSHIAWHPKTGD
jgi:hypothetical protein